MDLETLRATQSIGHTNLIQFISRINQQYKEELDRINRVDNEICDEIVKKLRTQSQYRPITVTEVNILALSVHKKVRGKHMLIQTCSFISDLSLIIFQSMFWAFN